MGPQIIKVNKRGLEIRKKSLGMGRHMTRLRLRWIIQIQEYRRIAERQLSNSFTGSGLKGLSKRGSKKHCPLRWRYKRICIDLSRRVFQKKPRGKNRPKEGGNLPAGGA